jgi:hypothetical protein
MPIALIEAGSQGTTIASMLSEMTRHASMRTFNGAKEVEWYTR